MGARSRAAASVSPVWKTTSAPSFAPEPSGACTSVEFGLPTETFITGSEPALDTVHVNTLAGNDDVFVAPDVDDLITPIVDLGPES